MCKRGFKQIHIKRTSEAKSLTLMNIFTQCRFGSVVKSRGDIYVNSLRSITKNTCLPVHDLNSIPGHARSEQCLVSKSIPGQVFPPFIGGGFEQALVLATEPLPQDIVHDSQCDHDAHPPSTVIC